MTYSQNNGANDVAFVGHDPEVFIDNEKLIVSHDIEFDDLIERQPGWLLRSGIILVFGAVTLVFALASYIKYPDKLAAPFLLTTENPPIDVMALSTGQIAAWYVPDSQQIAKNEVLAYIDNAAKLEDVETFASFVEEVAAITNISDHLKLQKPENLQMGDLRQTYTTFVQTITSFQYLLRQRIVFQKMNTLKDKTNMHQQLSIAMQRQLDLFKKELALAEKDYQRNLSLNNQGAVSDLELEKIEALLLQKQQGLENLKSAIIQNNIAIEQLNTEWLELKDARSTSVDDYLVKLEQLTMQFRNEHNQWKKQYMVTAPLAGTVSIVPGIVENRMVNAGETIAGIIPAEEGEIIVAHISPSANGIGKIEVANKVLLQLDAYPYKEYGAVESIITNVSLLPVKDREGELVYEVTCELPKPIISMAGKVLPFRQKLTGLAQIITKDKSILERVLERVMSVQL